MAERFDVIVIGAGLGGLLTAAILARRGRRVLVLEREARVGGRLRSYEVEGCVVDAGAYLWPNRHLGPALEAAGATEFVASRIPLAQVLRIFVQGLGGQRFTFPWPGRPLNAELLAAAEAVLGVDADAFGRLGQLWERLAALSDAEVAALRYVPLRQALPRFAPDPRLAGAFRRNVMIFGTYDPDSAAMAECIGLRRRPADAPPAWPECPGANAVGGVRALPLAIARALAASGADVRCGWTVERIVIEHGRASGVIAHGPADVFQSRFAAAAVVSNVPIWAVFRLLPRSLFAPEFGAAADACAAVGGVVAGAFAFAGLPCLRESGEPDEYLGWTRLLTGPDAEFGGGMTWATLHSPHNAPPGTHILQAMRLSPHADLADAGRVAEIQAAFRAMLDEIYLDPAAQLLWSREWSTRDGSEYLIHSAPRPPVEAPGVAGLYFVGETTDVPAVQMDAAALSALRVAELIAP
jgi:phytoene dehydrogenase-like protein